MCFLLRSWENQQTNKTPAKHPNHRHPSNVPWGCAPCISPPLPPSTCSTWGGRVSPGSLSLCEGAVCESAPPHPRELSLGRAGIRGDRARDLGSCRVGDAARASIKRAGSGQHMPGQVPLCHLQCKVLGWAAGGIMLSCLNHPLLSWVWLFQP